MGKPSTLLTVLVVAPRGASRLGLAAALERRDGIGRCLVARNREEAVEMARRHDPDLVLLDVSGDTAAETAATVGAAIDAPQTSGDSHLVELTEREREVLTLIAAGATNREIAERVYLGPDAVKKHVSSILRKLGARNRTEAATLAGLNPPI